MAERICGALAWLSLAILAAVYAWGWGLALENPFSILYEGHVLWAARELSLGHNIYSLESLESLPFAVIIYPPLYMAAGAVLFKLFGPAVWLMRSSSMLAMVAALWLFYRILRRNGTSVSRSVVCLCFFMSFLPVFVWSSLARVDSLAFMLSVWAMERFLGAWSTPDQGKAGHSGYLWAMALLVLAILTKYQSVIPGLALVVFAFWNGRRRLAGLFLAGWSLPVALFSLLLQMATGGYLAHMTYLRNVPWDFQTLTYYAGTVGTDVFKIAAGAAVILAGLLLRHKISVPERMPYTLLIFSLSFTVYTMGIPSAATNHLLFTYLAFCWWCGLVLQTLPPWVASALVVVALANVPILHGIARFMNRLVPTAVLLEEQVPPAQLQGKLVLSEDPFRAAVLGAVPALVDGATFMNAWRDNPQALEPLVDAINSKRFPLIVINERDSAAGGGAVRWPPEVVRAVRRHYTLAGRTGGENLEQEIYVPVRE